MFNSRRVTPAANIYQMPTLVSTAQITITDQNDYIFSGTTPPRNPIANVTLWNDTSVTPILQKLWTGTAWEVVNEVNVGGRNLVKNSNKFRLGSVATGITTSITTEGYLQIIAAAGNGNWLSSWYDADSNLSFVESTLKEGDDFTISLEIKSPNAATPPTIYIKPGMGYYGMVGSVATEFTKIYYTGKWKDAKSIAPHFGFASAIGTYIIKNWQLEKGNKPTDWKLSQEDIDSAIAGAKLAGTNAQNTANTANQAVGNLNTYVDGAFRDGVIDTAEAQAIDKLNKDVNSKYNALINDYNVVFANAYLEGVAKADLLNAKVSLAGAKDALQNSINVAIADGKTTTAEKADVDSKFTAYDTAFAAYQTKLSNASKAIQDTLKSYSDTAQTAANNAATATAAAQTTANNAGDLAKLGQYGKMMYRDPSFATGLNGCNLYNDAGGTALSISRVAKQADSPSTSGYEMKVSYVGGSNGTAPSYGGFYFAAMSRANAIFMIKFIAKIPVGFAVGYASNAAGDGSSFTWLTPQDGTGRYEEYVGKIRCGTSGAFSSVGFIYLAGPASSAFDWYVSYATMVDLTDSDVYTIAAAQADATLAKERTEGRTVIDGGVVETNIVTLGTGGIAGMSGILTDSSNNPLPSRWTGGTYAQAIAKMATIIEWFNGDAKYGDFWIDANGSVCIKDSGGVNRVVMTRNDITTLAAIANSTQNTDISNVADFYSTVGTKTYFFANNITVNNNNSTVTINTALTTEVSPYSGKGQGISRVELYLNNISSGVDIFIDSATARAINTLDRESIAVNKQLVIAAGTYRLKAVYIHTNYVNQCSFASQVSASTINVFFDGSTQRLEIGKNGMGIIGNATNYSFRGIEGGIFKVVEKTTGVHDVPGVLAAGNIASSGANTNRYGAKASSSPATKSGTGIYNVPHSIGNSAFTAIVTPATDSVTCRVLIKTGTQFVVYCRNSSNTLVDAAFEYLLIGSNS